MVRKTKQGAPYETPALEVALLEPDDVITTSSENGDDHNYIRGTFLLGSIGITLSCGIHKVLCGVKHSTGSACVLREYIIGRL